MRRPRAFLCLWLAVANAPVLAQSIITSPSPERVAVTIYRAPYRNPRDAFDLAWLDGYALISETRRIAIPTGESEIRFEGVAGGILPQSAIISGFPDGIVERNRDANLLSATSLIDRSLGRRVHLRRTSPATGAVREQEAVIRSGADGALVLQTAEGFESLRCSGQNETPIYDQVPPGLSARPTLSVRTRSRQPVAATVTLSYLATGFDWRANYVANLSADGSHVDLFAWVTLASSDETSFRDADTQAVAGRVHREEVEPESRETPSLRLLCWPRGNTSNFPPVVQNAPVTVISSAEVRLQGTTRTEDLIDSLPQAFAATASRVGQEELGDLKLYRITEPVTVAANNQKQVAFLVRPNVPVRTIYRSLILPYQEGEADAVTRILLTRNRAEEGLGLPLPAGGVQLFTEGAGRPILLGEGAVEDRAIGEDVEIEVGEGPGVTTRVTEERRSGRRHDFLLTVTNDRADPIPFEAEFSLRDSFLFRPRIRLGTGHGRPMWAVTVPANGSATLHYRIIDVDD